MATRNIRPFVHLRVLSSYSLGLGLSTPGDICRHARRVGFDTVALTDVSGTFGFAEFHRAAREAGVKPIYGTLLYIDWSNPPAPDDPVQSLILLALDRTGLRNVCAAATASATKRERGHGFYVEDLEGTGDGVVAIAGLDLGRSDIDLRHVLLPLRDTFADRLFVECRDGLGGAEASIQSTFVADAGEAGVSPVLVQDVRFVGPARAQLAELIVTGEDPSYEHRVFGDARAGDARPGHGMRTAAEMSEAFEALPEAHANAAMIAALVQPDLYEAVEQAAEPAAPTPMFDAETERDAVLRSRVEAALSARERETPGDTGLRATVEAELARIEGAGIADRFLQYGEIGHRLRAAGVNLGPATGLTLQSRCAWLLGITVFDPYALDDTFDPEFEARAEATRILDLQIAPEQRPRVLATLNKVYDDASIGYVPSVEHITAARALRIAARRIEVPAPELAETLRIASRHPGMTLRELSEDSRSLGNLYRRSAAIRDLVAHAASIEGLPFGFARTKRTIAVSSRSLRAMFGYMVNPETGDHFIQSTRDSFPLGGIRRIDVEPLHALAWVGRDGNWDTSETEPYRLVADGDLDGIHLLEGRSGGLATRFGIGSFSDLVLFVALLRHRSGGPGMLARMESFRGETAKVPAAEMVGGILAPTNGWVLFLDQARDVLARLTDLPRTRASEMLARFADHTPGNLAALRREFLKYTVEVSVPLDDATAWFTRLMRLARNAQNRQRVLAECLIIHRSLVVKHTDRMRFLAHALDHAAGGEKRRRLRAMLREEHRWLSPDVNNSSRRHRVEDGRIRPPLWDVNGVSREVSDAIVRARGPGRYDTLQDLRLAIGGAGIHPDVVDTLLRARACESIAETAATGGVPEGGEASLAPAGPPQAGMDLTGETAAVAPGAKDKRQRTAFRVVEPLSDFHGLASSTPVELQGRLRSLQRYSTNSGKAVGVFDLVAAGGSVRTFIPWELAVRNGEPWSEGVELTVRGRVRVRDGKKICEAVEAHVAGVSG